MILLKNSISKNISIEWEYLLNLRDIFIPVPLYSFKRVFILSEGIYEGYVKIEGRVFCFPNSW